MIQENSGFQFDAPKYESSYIKVIGVGGGGTNAVNHMYTHGIEGVDFIVCNTDDKSLDSSPVPTKIKLGKNGLGAGNIPSVAREKALEVSELLKEHLSKNTQMLFITAGMGGGTGTGAAPVIAKLAKEIEIDDDVSKILVVAIVTLPFSFEGRRRRLQAEEGIAELKKHVDAILIINNDKLRDLGNMGLRDAFSKADDILLIGAKGIAEIITVKSYINIDFRDVNTVMQSSGVALMGSGIAEGEDRAMKAIQMATNSVLLNDNDIRGAKNILLYLSSGPDNEITMDEIGEITDYIRDETGNEADVIWGAGFDEKLGRNLNITLIATGFEAKKIADPEVSRFGQMQTDRPSPINKPETINVVKNPDGITLLTLEDEKTEGKAEGSKTLTLDEPKKENDPIINFEIISTESHIAENKEPEMPTASVSFAKDEPFVRTTSREEIEAKREIEITEPKPYIADNTVNERAARMRAIREKLESAGGLEELEKKPAYEIMERTLFEPKHSSQSEVSRITLDEENVFMKENPYLYENPD